MEDLHDAYVRFKYYFDKHGGVYLYNGYEADLRTILNFVGEEFMGLEGLIDDNLRQLEGDDNEED